MDWFWRAEKRFMLELGVEERIESSRRMFPPPPALRCDDEYPPDPDRVGPLFELERPVHGLERMPRGAKVMLSTSNCDDCELRFCDCKEAIEKQRALL